MKNVFINLSLCLLLSGCLLGPNYKPPEPMINDDWSSLCADDTPAVPCVDPPVAWWQIFEDPLLNKYIEMAAYCNNSVLGAEACIWQARALRQVTASELFPHVSADLNATRTYFSKNGPLFVFTPGGQNPNSLATGLPFQIQIPQIQNLYNALIDVSWEIDIFGKRRRSVEAADANIGSAIEQRNATLVSIFAEVALNYIELRSNQQRGILLAGNLDLLERNIALAIKRHEAGLTDLLDLERIEAEWAQVAANLPGICAGIYQNIYALSILTGHLPEFLVEELLPLQGLPCMPCEIAVGLRSDLLKRRPDVRKAERQLAAATANIGVAVASFFPSFTLLGDIGLQSLSLSNLFEARSLTWAVGGFVNVPIFQGGKLVGNLRANEATAASAAFNYQQAVLTALKEAESALIFYNEELKASEKLKEAVDRYAKLVFLVNERYMKGLVSLSDLLDTERQWNFSQQNLLTSETTALIDLITLYKALGGGWECPS